MTLAALDKRVRYWQRHPALIYLGLASWDIKVEWVEDDAEFEDSLLESQDVLASCEADETFDEATLSFNKERIEESDIDRVIVHELLHAFMRDFDEAQTAGLEKYMAVPALKDFLGRLRHEREGVVDRMARTIIALDRK